jgi:hypothetical protein
MGIQIFNAILTPTKSAACITAKVQEPHHFPSSLSPSILPRQSKCKCTQRVHMYQEPLLMATNDRFTEGSVLVNSTIPQINTISIFTYSTYIAHERTKIQGTQKQVMELHNLYSSADLIRVIIRRDQTGPTTLMH